jgi:glycosyltransferase involved in cell wall biosynthesis
MPVYNEQNTIDTILHHVFDAHLKGWEKEVIVVDDGSTDKTRERLRPWEHKCTVLHQPNNQGKGAAVSKGLTLATGEIILIQDADLEYNPTDYPKLLEPFLDSRVEIVYGSRFLGPHMSTMFIYSSGNKFVTFITNILYNTNITDMETGYKVFRKNVLDGITLRAHKFDFEPEFTAKILKAGHQIYEIPISYFGRKFSEGKKLTWRDGIVALWTLIKYKFTD